MKTFARLITGVMITLVSLSCEKTELRGDTLPAIPQAENTPSSGKGGPVGVCNPNAFAVNLESKTLVGSNWEWTWSVTNTNPGNGNNGTFQDLSNWGMQLASCVEWSTIVGAAYSGDGVTWTSFTPAYQVDPSQTCLNTPSLKFDFGTNGSAPSYYRLVVSQDYILDLAGAYYKSGSTTGCCTFQFMGMGCAGGPTEERIGF